MAAQKRWGQPWLGFCDGGLNPLDRSAKAMKQEVLWMTGVLRPPRGGERGLREWERPVGTPFGSQRSDASGSGLLVSCSVVVPIFTSRSLAGTSHHLTAAAPCGPGQVSRGCRDRCEGEGAARYALGDALYWQELARLSRVPREGLPRLWPDLAWAWASKSLSNTFLLFSGVLERNSLLEPVGGGMAVSGWLAAPRSPPGSRWSRSGFRLGASLEHLACEGRCGDSTSGAKGQDLGSGRSS